MKFFADTANLDQIRQANELGILDGVTTNPSLMAREGIKGKRNIQKHYVNICNIVDGDVSAEALSTTYDEMVAEGKELAELHKRIVVKLPCTADGIRAVKYFSTKCIKTNCTLIFSVGQALLAAKAGATYVSPFVGRLDDISSDGVSLVADIAEMFNYYSFKTKIIAASIRNVQSIVDCMKAGAHVATCPLDTILGLLNHPLTDKGLEIFVRDAAKME